MKKITRKNSDNIELYKAIEKDMPTVYLKKKKRAQLNSTKVMDT